MEEQIFTIMVLIVIGLLLSAIVILIGRGIYALYFCDKHDYELVNQFTIPSEFDMVHEAGRTPNTHNSQTRRYVSDYKCKNCGKIKRLTAKSV